MKKSLGAKTLVYPTPVFVVGTYDSNGRPNAMTASWGGICSSQPPCITVSLRKATYTYANIIERRAFSISIPSENHVKQADFFGLVSGRNTDKFAATGLTAERSILVDAPYIKEFPMILECKLAQTIELGIHTQFVGYIVDVKVDKAVLNDDDTADILKLKPLLFTPDAQTYHAVGQLVGKAFSVGKS